MIPFFPRGHGPLASVLICSRGRPTLLTEAVDSCVSLAKHKNLIEFVLKVDDDDKDTWETAQQIKNRLTGTCCVKICYGPRGNGYDDIDKWLAQMSKEAQGDWLFIFNDDAKVTVQDWDVKLNGLVVPHCWHICPQDVWMVVPEANNNPASNEFVLIRRNTSLLMGHLGLTPYADQWLIEVLGMVHSVSRTSLIKVDHYRRPELAYAGRDREPNYWTGTATLVSTAAVLGKLATVAKLAYHIEHNEMRGLWGPTPQSVGWYHWRPHFDHDPTHVYLEEDGRVLVYGKDACDWHALADLGGFWRPRVVKEPT